MEVSQKGIYFTAMSYLPATKWGVCSNCGGDEQEVVKVKKDLFCLPCRNTQKALEQIEKSKRRESAKRQGFKLRNDLAESKGTDEYFAAERQALINDLDFVFSRLIRMSAADERGFAECYTCGRSAHWTLQQCGHFIPRANMQTRWMTKNARVQDKNCNEGLHGNLEVFAQKLEEEEKGLPERLRELSREVHKWTTSELKEELINLRAKLRIIEQKFKPKP